MQGDTLIQHCLEGAEPHTQQTLCVQNTATNSTVLQMRLDTIDYNVSLLFAVRNMRVEIYSRVEQITFRLLSRPLRVGC